VRRRLFAVLLALSALLGTGLVFAAAASAHATIVATDPSNGSRLTAAPATISMTFDESVGLGAVGYLHVIDQTGKRVDSGAATHPDGDGTKVSVALKSGLGDGSYTASYRVVSADSHPIAGAFRFLVGNGSFTTAALSAPSAVNGLTSKTFDVIRWIAFAALAVLGGGWLMLTVWPAGRDDRKARRLLWAGWWGCVGAGVAEILIQGPYDAGVGLSGLFRWGLLDATLHSNFGLAHSLRLIALGILAAVLGTLLRYIERTRTGLEELAGMLLVAIAVTFAASGHAAAENPAWLAMTSTTAHLVAMAIWGGGLLFLLVAVLPRREPGELRVVLPAFSRTAYVCVATLAVTGTYQAWIGVGSWRALADTNYGRLVLLKILLFGGLLVLGNLSRQWVSRRFGAPVTVAYAMTDAVIDEEPEKEPEPTDVRTVRRSVLVEVLLAAVVLAATGVLVAQPTGAAALNTIDARPLTVRTTVAGNQTAAVTVSTQRHGSLAVSAVFTGGTAPTSVTATAALSAKQLGPIEIPLTAQGSSYSASSVLLPDAGAWVITLTVRTSQFDSTVAAVTVVLH
jgi:copper transport protein